MRNRYLLVADVAAIIMAAWGAFALRFGWFFIDERLEFVPFVVAAVVIKIGTFVGFGLYRRYWRYAGFSDLMAIVLANSAASIGLSAVIVGSRLLGWIPLQVLFQVQLDAGTGFSRSVPPLDWLFTLALTVGLRASVRAVTETFGKRPRRGPTTIRNVLIVGAGDAGAMVVREMQRNLQLGLRPVGFLDDDPVKTNKQIYSLRVLGRLDELAEVAQARRVDEVVISIPTAGGSTVREVVELCQRLGLPSRVMPGIYELLDGQLSVSRLRTVDIADLLRRPQLHSASASPDYLRGARVLITGAGGSIGSELCRQLAHAAPARLVILGHGENSIFEIAAEMRRRFPGVSIQAVIADVRDRDRILRVFTAAAPDTVLHVAAHKHVPLMEDDASEAVTNNVGGTRNVVDAAITVGVQRFVMVSTDKAAAPSNMMGASKRLAELIVQRAARMHGRAFVVVRFGNVLGSRGSVVPTFKGQIDRGGPVTVTHPDVRRYFMTIPEAVHLILEAGGIGSGSELFVLDMGAPVLLKDLAADMIRLSGFEEAEIPIVFTGLRPGEKLDEILWEEGASVEATERRDIRRVLEAAVVPDEHVENVVMRILDAAARDDHERIARLFRECIPSATVVPRSRRAGSGPPVLVVKQPGA